MIWRNIFLVFGATFLVSGALLGLVEGMERAICTALAGVGFMVGSLTMAVSGQHKQKAALPAGASHYGLTVKTSDR